MKLSKLKNFYYIPIIAVIIAALIVGNVVAFGFTDQINSLLCPPVSNSAEREEAAKEGQKLAREIMEEGAVLVRNENSVLPLDRSVDKRVNVFGCSSVDWAYGGSGSGRIRPENDDPTTLIDFLGGLKRYGIEANQRLTAMYKSFRKIGRQEEAQDKGMYELYEPNIADKKYYSDELLDYAKEYSETAIVTLSRFGAEGVDHSTEIELGLIISDEERALMEYVGKNYEKTIVIINSANTMQLDFLESIEGLDACLVVGLTGSQAAQAIPSLLYGEKTPSGRLADTYAYDFKSNVNYTHGTGSGWYQPNGMFDYIEGIYVGYKWYETAFKEGVWNKADNAFGKGYDGVVQYPFGFGLSYTEFVWRLDSFKVENENGEEAKADEINEKSVITINVNVENVGKTSGKDVVQVYLTAPYTKGGIEKSFVNLVGFEKTALLAPGESQTISISVLADDFASYDCYDKNGNNFKGYELEKGEYVLKLMQNCHDEKDFEDNELTFTVKDDIKVQTDYYSGEKVYNKFTGDNAWDGASLDGNDNGIIAVEYVTRANMPDPAAVEPMLQRALNEKQNAVKDYSKNFADEWDNATTSLSGEKVSTEKVKWNEKNGLSVSDSTGKITELGLKLGKDYFDPDWENLLDQLSIEEAANMVSNAYATTQKIASIGKIELIDYDGPSQIKSFSGAPRGTAYPGNPVVAQTWNKNLAYRYGMSFGKDMISVSVNGLYGFGCNIHRTPFGGRNFEYYSEDAFLSGEILSFAIKGLQNTGRYAFIKHLALNETESGRKGAYTFVTEQAMREIYLKPFKMAVHKADCVAMMSAYNRVGAVYAGRSQAMIEGVVRGEWGFKGMIITDCSDDAGSYYMNMDGALRAGGDLGMMTKLNGPASPYKLDYSYSSTPRLQTRLREAVKHVTYAYLRVQYINAEYNEKGEASERVSSTATFRSWQWWKPVIYDLDILFVAALILWGYFATKKAISGLKETETKEQENA